MSPAKSFSVEKRITRSAARIILNEKSNQTSSLVMNMESQLNDHVIDTKGKRMKKAQLVPATSEFESGMGIAHDWYLSIGVIHFFSLSFTGLIQAELLLGAKVANVISSFFTALSFTSFESFTFDSHSTRCINVKHQFNICAHAE